MTKEFQTKTSFVHNCIANKNKSNISHFENIYNKKVFNRQKYKILRVLHENKVDFRKMTMLKNELFESEQLDDNHLVPISVWKESLGIMGGDLDCCEDMILDEIRQGENVNLMKFTDIVDLFYFLPMMKEHPNNDSSNVFYIMSSNTASKPIVENIKTQGGILKRMLDMLYMKLSEKYRNLAEAYRYFDFNFNNRVSFAEFQKTLDHMRIKYQVNEVNAIF